MYIKDMVKVYILPSIGKGIYIEVYHGETVGEIIARILSDNPELPKSGAVLISNGKSIPPETILLDNVNVNKEGALQMTWSIKTTSDRDILYAVKNKDINYRPGDKIIVKTSSGEIIAVTIYDISSLLGENKIRVSLSDGTIGNIHIHRILGKI